MSATEVRQRTVIFQITRDFSFLCQILLIKLHFLPGHRIVLVLDGNFRTCCVCLNENRSNKTKKIRFVTALDPSKCLKQDQVTEIAPDVRTYF